MRDMMAIVEKVDCEVLPLEYDMNLKELQELDKVASVDLVRAFGIAFKYGFVLGKRAYKNGRKKIV